MTAHRIIAASPTRRTTMVKGGSSRTATPVKKKDPPHRTDSASSIAHSADVMLRLAGVGMARTVCSSVEGR